MQALFMNMTRLRIYVPLALPCVLWNHQPLNGDGTIDYRGFCTVHTISDVLRTETASALSPDEMAERVIGGIAETLLNAWKRHVAGVEQGGKLTEDIPDPKEGDGRLRVQMRLNRTGGRARRSRGRRLNHSIASHLNSYGVRLAVLEVLLEVLAWKCGVAGCDEKPTSGLVYAACVLSAPAGSADEG